MSRPPDDGRLPITAAVLAGGESQRMGADKALIEVNGRTLVERAVDSVRHLCEETIVVTGDPETLAEARLPSDVRIVSDEVPGLGPLGGLVTALASAGRRWVLALAVDMPFVDPAVLRLLWDSRDHAEAVVPLTGRGAEPMLALYAKEPCLRAARSALEAGERRPLALLDTVDTVEVGEGALREADPELRSLENVNTPADLERIRRLPVERPLTVVLNGSEIGTLMSTPTDPDELAVGFLVAEGILGDRDALGHVDVDGDRGVVSVSTSETLPDAAALRDRVFTSGCGRGFTFATLGHASDLLPVEGDVRVTVDDLSRLMRDLSAASAEYRRTGGLHACGLARDGELLLVREDVGRHNALDKVLGRAWLEGLTMADAVLLSTGRLSYEMAVKAAKAGVPVVASRSAVTDLAADVAETLGMTLVGYVRGGGAVVQTHPGRIEGRE